MKLKRIQFAQQHVNWASGQWSRVLFSDESCMSVKETARFFFVSPGTTMAGSKYLKLLKNKQELHLNVHQCDILMKDGAPCHKSKIVTNFLKSRKIRVLHWLGIRQQSRLESNRKFVDDFAKQCV